MAKSKSKSKPNQDAAHFTPEADVLLPSNSYHTPSPHARHADTKPAGWAFWEALGRPRYVVAPMVDQSELAWRVLSRRYGAQLVYTPMINAKMYLRNGSDANRAKYFDITSGEEGSARPLASTSTSNEHSATSATVNDRPLLAQFCANDPMTLLRAAEVVQDYCDGIDLNLGCPQDIARRGGYGAWLMDPDECDGDESKWGLIYRLVNILHLNLRVPVTAKFRVFEDVDKTVRYAQMLERAGAQIIACHGRTRDQRGVNSGLASLKHIRAVKQAVKIPVLANGNVLFPQDVETVIRETGCEGIMCAEGQLYNPALFNGLTSASASEALPSTHAASSPKYDPDVLLATHLHSVPLALEYLSIVLSLRTVTGVSAIKGHLFKILLPALKDATDLREKLGKANVTRDWALDYDLVEDGDGVRRVLKAQVPPADEIPAPTTTGKTKGARGKGGGRGLQDYIDIIMEVGERMCLLEATWREEGRELVTVDNATGLPVLPPWFVQPYVRPPPPPKPVPVQKETQKVEVSEMTDQGGEKEVMDHGGKKEAGAEQEPEVPAKRPHSPEEGVEVKRVRTDTLLA